MATCRDPQHRRHMLRLVERFAGMFARATMWLRNARGSPRPAIVRWCGRRTCARLVNLGVDQTNQRFGGQREIKRWRGGVCDQTSSPSAGGRWYGNSAKRPAKSRENARLLRKMPCAAVARERDVSLAKVWWRKRSCQRNCLCFPAGAPSFSVVRTREVFRWSRIATSEPPKVSRVRLRKRPARRAITARPPRLPIHRPP